MHSLKYYQQQRTIVSRSLLPRPSLCSTVTRPCVSKQQMIHRSRPLSFWTLPRLVLATTNKKNRRLVYGAIGAAGLLSSVFGPVVWIAVGGVSSLVGWRIYRKAKSWWNYLTPPQVNATATEWLLSKVGTHKATELVRKESIKQLSNYFQSGGGKKVLEAFGLDHEKELIWEDVYKSETTRLDKERFQVLIYFWLSDEMSRGPQGGSCQVTASAIVSGSGQIQMESLLLNAPGWHEQETIPIK
ncbi:hypothetical protein G6F57_005239 [Rhizopus arrhizus]|uniref:Uncharacterized protein n=1 Tax=Rhizopus oryzae TaxID=64495 RepID=A0A9P7BVK1_RHIOR|nr:hypothetical protein G6F23_011383 [Rhizopus arrhizus]KAG0764936.1 hypothetical protein G6F24_004827 [Rhizopus arrhizus]KAG0778504.1 hypothetical protein G6F22_011195 [Rhizopus arrhizus]KAG0791581.1 hypothetical protein G6F21_004986 [Rhizopus arrhizus]KAG0812779.1 hypothetical protein G6F20_006092 [Rhizopus arrhizus]